jgi:hypothetical protein
MCDDPCVGEREGPEHGDYHGRGEACGEPGRPAGESGAGRRIRHQVGAGPHLPGSRQRGPAPQKYICGNI